MIDRLPTYVIKKYVILKQGHGDRQMRGFMGKNTENMKKNTQIWKGKLRPDNGKA